MGLDFSHSNAHWSYSGFNHFRWKLAREIGFNLYDMQGFGGDTEWSNIVDPLSPFLNHSDCDGVLTRNECFIISARIKELVVDWPDDDLDKMRALELSKGMLEAAKSNEEFFFC